MKTYITIVTALTLLFSCSSGNTDVILEKMERSLPADNPSSAPENWIMAHLDVETTGLLPGYHEMIDFGIVYTDLEGNILDSLFLRVIPEHPQRLSEGAKMVNAFDPEDWKTNGAVTKSQAVDSLTAFHRRTAGDRNVLLTSYNSHFDAAFLDHLFRDTGGSWRELYHYFILDIPSMAWALGYRDLTGDELMNEIGIADEPHIAHLHTGITGAMLNVRIYKALQGKIPRPDKN